VKTWIGFSWQRVKVKCKQLWEVMNLWVPWQQAISWSTEHQLCKENYLSQSWSLLNKVLTDNFTLLTKCLVLALVTVFYGPLVFRLTVLFTYIYNSFIYEQNRLAFDLKDKTHVNKVYKFGSSCRSHLISLSKIIQSSGKQLLFILWIKINP
jgi:hypothetical protein